MKERRRRESLSPPSRTPGGNSSVNSSVVMPPPIRPIHALVVDFSPRQWIIFISVSILSSFVLLGPLIPSALSGVTAPSVGLVEDGISTTGFPPVNGKKNSHDIITRIMIDAGSTGTRLHAFNFRWERTKNAGNLNSKLPKKDLILDSHAFHKLSPGLSAYADDPKQAGGSIIPLLEFAKSHIPKERWSKTKISLHATAGLRLLSQVTAQQILDECKTVLESYPFVVSGGDEAVSIISGIDEGLFGWLTLSFITHDLFRDVNPIASLDLGGASTQVTFETAESDPKCCSHDHQSITRKYFGTPHHLYTHSYLGLGIMRARESILRRSLVSGMNDTIQSPCIHPDEEAHWSYQGPAFTILGDPKGEFSMEACYKEAVAVIDSFKPCKRPELAAKTMYLMSYFFERAQDIGLLETGEPLKNMTVGDYFTGAQNACTHDYRAQVFLCTDLTYIAALLHHGYNLTRSTPLVVVDQLDGKEISWALGAAIADL